EMRYAGQGHEVECRVPLGALWTESLPVITASFESAYRALYHRLPQGVPIEALNWRLTVSGPKPTSEPTGRPEPGRDVGAGTERRRRHEKRSRGAPCLGPPTECSGPAAPAMMDPVTLEICWSRLIGVVNEQAAALQRTSFTSIVREAGDLSAGVFDRRGYMVAQAVTGTPGHINSMALAMKHFLAAYPLETLRAGDVLITNDPTLTSRHLNAVTIASPIF